LLAFDDLDVLCDQRILLRLVNAATFSDVELFVTT